MRRLVLVLFLVLSVFMLQAFDVEEFKEFVKSPSKIISGSFQNSSFREGDLSYYIEQEYLVMDWHDIKRFDYTYNNDGLVSQIDVSSYQGPNVQLSQKMIFEYNNENLLESILIQMYSSLVDEWADFMRISAEYNGLGNLIKYRLDAINISDMTTWNEFITVWFVYAGGTVSNMVMREMNYDFRPITYSNMSFEYDGNMRPTNLVTETSEDSLNWELDDKEEMIYNPNDNSSYDDWQVALNNMVYSITYNYVYSQWVNIMIDEVINYDYVGSDWVYSEKESFSYSGDLVTEIIAYEYAGGWQEWDRQAFEYNDDDQVSVDTHFDWEGEWVNSYRYLYTWGAIDNEDEYAVPSNNLRFSNYPNPFCANNSERSNVIKISFEAQETGNASVNIYNVIGQNVGSISEIAVKKGVNEVNWNTLGKNGKPVESGIYFIVLKNGKSVSTQKQLIIR